jgi:hypothetical protein
MSIKFYQNFSKWFDRASDLKDPAFFQSIFLERFFIEQRLNDNDDPIEVKK